MAQYVLTPAAKGDLATIVEYIAQDSVDVALQVLERFEEVLDLLAENPGIGHLREDLASRRIRFFPVHSYLVVYLAEVEPLRVVRILSAARDIKGILG
ncbi:MAG: type II toxin-antitoxin system RelE/ParE family toxin [Pseudomonadota bacterium]